MGLKYTIVMAALRNRIILEKDRHLPIISVLHLSLVGAFDGFIARICESSSAEGLLQDVIIMELGMTDSKHRFEVIHHCYNGHLLS